MWALKKPYYLNKKDKRYARHVKQLKKYGFSDSETWTLYSPIAQFILPRLIRFKEVNVAFPGDLTFEKWNLIIDEMIFAFDWTLNYEDDKYDNITDKQIKENWERCEKGMQLFSTHFMSLWW